MYEYELGITKKRGKHYATLRKKWESLEGGAEEQKNEERNDNNNCRLN